MKIRRFLMEDWLAEYKDRCRYNLGESGMPDMTVGELLARCGSDAGLLEAIVLKDHDTRGTERLRRAIHSSYSGDVPFESITVTTGTSEALFILFNLLLDGRSNVVAPFPSFQALYEVPRALGAEIRTYRLDETDGFIPDPGEIAGLVDGETGFVVVNSPHNPSGVTVPETIARDIVECARKHGAWVIADEHYRFLPHDGDVPLKTFAQFGEQVVATGSITKCFGVIGLRMGWISAPEKLVGPIRDFRDYLTHTLSPLSDLLAALLLENSKAFVAPAQNILRKNKLFLLRVVRETAGLGIVEPDAGVVAFPSFTYPVDSDSFARGLVDYADMFVLPGSAFETEGHVRVNLGAPPGDFEKAMELFGAYCQTCADSVGM